MVSPPVISARLRRASAAPELPTLAETILPGFDVITWFGLSVPTGVPRPIIDRLNRELNEFLRAPANRERFNAQDIVLLPRSPEALTERITQGRHELLVEAVQDLGTVERQRQHALRRAGADADACMVFLCLFRGRKTFISSGVKSVIPP